MSDVILAASPAAIHRRSFFSGLGRITLSATAIALLAGQDRLAVIGPANAQSRTDQAQNDDVAILNAALGAEQEAIAAYGVGAASGLLQKSVLDLAIQFQGHHKEHADALAATVKKLGGTPVEARKSYSFPTQKLKAQADVLVFAAELERGAVSAYLGAVPILADRDLAKVAASILGDEAMHWAVLRQALGQNPVPTAFLT